MGPVSQNCNQLKEGSHQTIPRAMCYKIVAALAMALLVLGAAEGQVLPTPCCRFDCCDGIRCCVASPGMAVDVVTPSPSPAVAFASNDAKAPRPGGASRKIGAGY